MSQEGMPATGPHHVPNDVAQRRSAVTDDVPRCLFPTRKVHPCDKAASKSTGADLSNDYATNYNNMPKGSSNNNTTPPPGEGGRPIGDLAPTRSGSEDHAEVQGGHASNISSRSTRSCSSPCPTNTRMSRAPALTGAPNITGSTTRIDAAHMTTYRSNSDHYGNEHHTNNSNYAEFVLTVVQSKQDASTPSLAKYEHNAIQANINSQIRLAKSMSHTPTEADLQQPPKRQKTYGHSNRPLCITPGRPSTIQAPKCIDLATDSHNHNQPPDLRQPASTTDPTTPSAGRFSELRQPTPTTNDVPSRFDGSLSRTWRLVQSTWVPNASIHDNQENPPDPHPPPTVSPTRRLPTNNDSSTYVDPRPPPTTSPTRRSLTTNVAATYAIAPSTDQRHPAANATPTDTDTNAIIIFDDNPAGVGSRNNNHGRPPDSDATDTRSRLRCPTTDARSRRPSSPSSATRPNLPSERA